MPSADQGDRTVVVARADLLRHHDPVRVQGYCRTCEHHGAVWSCPPFAEAPLSAFPAWSHAVILCQLITLRPGTTTDQLLEQFLAGRLAMGTWLRHLEACHPQVTALIAGHCAECPACTRPLGRPCAAPERRRYSLESVGFDVTALTKDLAGIEIPWPKSGVPEHLLAIGALLCPSKTVAEALAQNARNRPVT